MKKSLVIAILIFAAKFAVAQGPIAKGQVQLNAGLGLSTWGIPVYVGLDFGIHKDITLGVEVSYRTYNDNFLGIGYNHTVTGILVNGNYHFNSLLHIPTKWDLYAGPNIGFYNWTSPAGYAGSYSSGLGFGAQVGGRYYFNDKFGINLEAGRGNVLAGGKFGISLRF